MVAAPVPRAREASIVRSMDLGSSVGSLCDATEERESCCAC